MLVQSLYWLVMGVQKEPRTMLVGDEPLAKAVMLACKGNIESSYRRPVSLLMEAAALTRRVTQGGRTRGDDGVKKDGRRVKSELLKADSRGAF